MAAFDTTRPISHGAFAEGRFAKLFARSASAFAQWNDARVTRKALSHLSDRELQDIGLSRGDIETVATTGRIR